MASVFHLESKTIHRSHAEVFARLHEDHLTITMIPDDPRATNWIVPMDLVPQDARVPNTPLRVTWSMSDGVIGIERRDPEDQTPMSCPRGEDAS